MSRGSWVLQPAGLGGCWEPCLGVGGAFGPGPAAPWCWSQILPLERLGWSV